MLIAPQWSEVQKREVTTYLVSAPGGPSGYFCGIQQAIDKAEPYSRIVVASGQYSESVTVTTPMELIGEEGDSPELCGRGTRLSVAGDVECYFENLRIIYKGSTFVGAAAANAPRGSNASVRLVQGRATFRNCEMTSVYVGGSSAPNISNCNIIGSMAGSGLVIAEDAGGEYSRNEIANHVPWCISISSRGEPKLNENDVYQDLKYIAAHSHSKMINGGAVLITREGIDTDRTISPKFEGNRIRDDYIGGNISTSVTYEDMSKYPVYNPELEKIIFAERATVRVDSTCRPKFHDNHMLGGCVGIHFAVGAGGDFTSNVVVASNMYGVVLEPYSCPNMRVNTISRCRTGIHAESTCATLSRNTIRECDGSGMLLLVTDEDRFNLDQNTFVGNDTGIAVRPGTKALLNASSNRLALLVEREFEEQKAAEALFHAEEASARAAPYDPYAMDTTTSTTAAAGSKGASVTSPPGASSGVGVGGLKPSNSAGPFDAPTVGSMLGADVLAAAAVRATVIQKNIVTHNRACGITVYGSGCSAHLRDLEVVNNGRFGILCSFGSTPTFESVLFDDGGIGIVSEKSANPTISECTFSGQTKACILVRDRGRALISKNKLHNFSGAGVMVQDGGNPLIQENLFQECRGTGVIVTNGGISTISENQFDTVCVGVEISAFGDPFVSNNTFHQCTEMGVYVHEEGAGTLIDNSFTACSVGVGVNSGGQPTVRGNTMVDSMRTGFIGGDQSLAIVEKNAIRQSISGNILLEGDGSNCIVRRNRVQRANGYGIRADRNAEGIVQRNDVSENGDGGLGTMNGANTSFIDNIVQMERGPGIVVREKGRGFFKGNNVGSCHRCAIEFGPGSDAVVEDCLFSQNAEAGVHVLDGAGSVVRNCIVTKNKGGISFVGVNCRSTIRFENIAVESNEEFGIQLLEAGTGSLHDCRVKGQKVGLLLDGSGKATFERCEVLENTVGARMIHHSCASILDCNFHHNEESDVIFADAANGLVSKCKLSGGTPIGVLCQDGSKGVMESCAIFDVTTAAIVAQGGANTVFEQNNIYNNAEGVICEKGSHCDFKENTFSKNLRSNARLKVGCRSRFNANTLEYSPNNGITMEACCAIITNNEIRYNVMHGIEFLSPPKETDENTEDMPSTPTRRRAVAKVRAKAKAVSLLSAAGKGGGGSGEGGSLPSVADQATSTIPHVTGNTIHDNGRAGCWFADFARATLIGNTVHTNKAGGAVVGIGATPELRTNTFHENTLGGLIISDRGSPTAVGNTFYRNAPCNIQLMEGSLGRLEENEIKHGFPDGIRALGSTTVVVSNNIIDNTDGNGIALEGPNEYLLVTKNTIRSNAIGVMCTANHSSGMIRDNVITANAIVGVQLCGASQPTVERNVFENGSTGCLILSGALGRIADNRFTKNKEGIDFSGEPIHTICTANLFEGNTFAVCLRQNKSFRLKSNTFGVCEEASVLLEEGSTSVVAHNDFSSCRRGVLSRGLSAPFVELNIFSECPCGVEISDEAGGTYTANTFNHCGSGMLISSKEPNVTVVSNIFGRCMLAGMCVEGSGTPQQVVRNLFTHCSDTDQACGLLLRNGGGGRFFENDFHFNRIGVVAQRGALGEVSRALIHDSRLTAISITDSNTITSFVNCALFAKESGVCVHCAEAANPSVIQCLLQADKIALRVMNGGGGSFQANVIRDSHTAVLVEGAGSATMMRNTIHNCQVGLATKHQPSPSALFSSNYIHSCDMGCVTSSTGGCDVNGNVIAQCDIGILCDKRGTARFSNNTIVKHSKTGIHVRAPCTVACSNNVIADCGIAGIHIHHSAQHQQQQLNVLSSASSSAKSPKAAISASAAGGGGGGTTDVPAPHPPSSPSAAATASTELPASPHSPGGNLMAVASEDSSTFEGMSTPPLSPLAAGSGDGDGDGTEGFKGEGGSGDVGNSSMVGDNSSFLSNSAHTNNADDFFALKPAAKIATAMSPLSASVAAITEITFIENRVAHCRTNLSITNGQGKFTKNHFHNGDFGANVQTDAVCTFDGNIIYDNMRVGMMLASRNCHLTRNEFYSPNETGAFESESGYGLPRDNPVYNHCSAKMPHPPTNAPPKASSVVDMRSSTKDLRSSLSQSLMWMHTSELPAESSDCGCTLLGDHSRVRTQHLIPVVFLQDGSMLYGLDATGVVMPTRPTSGELQRRGTSPPFGDGSPSPGLVMGGAGGGGGGGKRRTSSRAPRPPPSGKSSGASRRASIQGGSKVKRTSMGLSATGSSAQLLPPSRKPSRRPSSKPRASTSK